MRQVRGFVAGITVATGGFKVMNPVPAITLASLLLAAKTNAPAERFEAAYDFSLSTNFGVLPLDSAQLFYDRGHRELYTVSDGVVRIFNESGMEIYSFGDDLELGMITGIVALEGGDLLVRARRVDRIELLRCSFRGELLSVVEPTGVPPELLGTLSGIMRYQGGRLYFAGAAAMRVLVLEESGAFVAAYDIAERMKVEDQRADLGLRGFNVDAQGNILFTIQPLFQAYLMTPSGEIQSFGQRGSAPGKFNIVAGIARDDAGNLYVADMLKSSILVFDPQYRFVREFGGRGGRPQNLVAPEEIAVSGDGRLFVSNRAHRGVSVFKVSTSVN
jgi:hypothetical protein